MRIKESRLTRTNILAVKEAMKAASNKGDVVLDLGRVQSVDSSAVSALLSWVRLTGKNARISNVPEKLMNLMKLYGIAGVLDDYLSTDGEKNP